MKRLWIPVTAVAVCVFLYGCTTEEVKPADRGEAYFPLTLGKVLEYKVDSIIFDDAGNSNVLDTTTTFVREAVTDIIVSVEGDTVFRIERSIRHDAQAPWEVTDVWNAGRTYTSVIRVEQNQRLIKMEFPLYTGRAWDPTRYIDPNIEVPVGTEELNMYAYWEGVVLSIDQPENIGTFQFDSVMTCHQADEDTDLERRYVMEKYAKYIGLVERMDTIVDSRCKRLGDFAPCEGMTWMEKGEKGYIMHMVLLNHN